MRYPLVLSSPQVAIESVTTTTATITWPPVEGAHVSNKYWLTVR